MTVPPERLSIDAITSDQLDALYNRLDFTEAALERVRDNLEVQVVRATRRAEQAEAAVERVRAYAIHLFRNANTRHAQDGLTFLALIANQPKHTLIDDRGELRDTFDLPQPSTATET